MKKIIENVSVMCFHDELCQFYNALMTVMSKLVSETGFVYGIDMTEAQSRVAEKYLDVQKKRFGYAEPNNPHHLAQIIY